MTITIVKEKIDQLEKQLLAVASLNDICQQSVNSGSRAVNLEVCVELLDHLVEPMMLQVEELRVFVTGMLARAEHQIIEEAASCS
ncbi:MAG: hypothetical protein K2Y28_09035 [Burkholderiaceae bacterium]|nr:hypothetical protein [Burkholderiaceae bacterium]